MIFYICVVRADCFSIGLSYRRDCFTGVGWNSMRQLFSRKLSCTLSSEGMHVLEITATKMSVCALLRVGFLIAPCWACSSFTRWRPGKRASREAGPQVNWSDIIMIHQVKNIIVDWCIMSNSKSWKRRSIKGFASFFLTESSPAFAIDCTMIYNFVLPSCSIHC